MRAASLFVLACVVGCARATEPAAIPEDPVDDATVDEVLAETGGDVSDDTPEEGARDGDTATTGDALADSAKPDTARSDAADATIADGPSDSAATDTAGGDSVTPKDAALGDAGPCHLVINELQVGTSLSGTNEFVEIYNPCAAGNAVLAGFKIVYRGGNVTVDTTMYTFGASAILVPGNFFVVSGDNFPGPRDAVFAGSAGLSPTGGVVALRNDLGDVIDAVGYGTTTSVLTEGTAAMSPGESNPATSIARTPNGRDTNDNSLDFTRVTSPTPKAANN